MGYTLSAFARGLDQTPVAKQNAHTAIKSVGNSATTPRDLTTDEDVWLMLVLLSESVAMRMRDLGSKCNVVEIYVRDNELSGFTRRRKLDNPTNVSIEIARIRKIHPHMFRHTFVSILLSNPDIGVATVAAEAGHAQPKHNLGYLHAGLPEAAGFHPQPDEQNSLRTHLPL